MKRLKKGAGLLSILYLLMGTNGVAQVLSLREAEEIATKNYPIIKAKSHYADASRAVVTQAKRDAYPNWIISIQQDYGTINGQNGPLYGLGGYGVASSGAPLPAQNWNAAFGALYLTNINWELFAFGKVREKIKTASAEAEKTERDLDQERFQHQVKVAAAYLNLLAAQRITKSLQQNLARADTLQLVVKTRAMNGLVAGVDSSLANAEVSAARIALLRAADAEEERSAELAMLMGLTTSDVFILDSQLVSRIPLSIQDSFLVREDHPELEFYKSRIRVSEETEKYFGKFQYPSFSVFSVLQTRGSGFSTNYPGDLTAFSHAYWQGVKPVRHNYLMGIGMTWNLTTPFRVRQQVIAQRFISAGLREELDWASQRLQAQKQLAESKIQNAVSAFVEAPVQVKAASDAYLQKSVLYKNGLATIVDVTQSLYALTRAETDRDIAYSNVWQALLLKAAVSGDINLFLNELP